MILLVSRYHAYAFADWLRSPRGRDLADRIRVLYYQDLHRRRRLPAGTWIFADLERLGPAQLELACRVWDALAASGQPVRLLNDPRRVLTRYALLRELEARGRNRFRAVRATEPLDGLRYPVFVREEREHTGSLTDLLDGPEALDRALDRLARPLRGFRRKDLLVVEFCDTSDAHGVFRKYSAVRIGPRILGQYLEFSRSWMVKAARRFYDEDRIREDREYVEENPHAETLRAIFDLAGVEYGRIDYSLLDGSPQVWEINTNPSIAATRWTIGRRERLRDDLRPRKARFDAAFRAALDEIGPGSDEVAAIPSPISPGLAFRAWLEWATMNLPAAYRELLRVPAYLREAYGSGGEGPVRERPGPAILPEGPPDGRAGPGGAGP